MKAQDRECPMCGTLNKGIFLEETDGWMECEKCGAVTRRPEDTKMKIVPRLANNSLSMPKRCGCSNTE